jgi:hypothetical protein
MTVQLELFSDPRKAGYESLPAIDVLLRSQCRPAGIGTIENSHYKGASGALSYLHILNCGGSE